MDDDPVWQEFLKASDPLEFWEQRGYKIPLAFYVDSADQHKLQRVLTVARRIDDLIVGRKIPREQRRYRGVDYIKVHDNFLNGNTKQAFYYSAGPKGFCDVCIKRWFEQRNRRADSVVAVDDRDVT